MVQEGHVPPGNSSESSEQKVEMKKPVSSIRSGVKPFKDKYGYAKYFYGDTAMVKIYVGSGSTRPCFTLPQDLLCYKIPYFRGAFKGDFKESVQKSIEFSEVAPETFAAVVNWGFDDYGDTHPCLNTLAWNEPKNQIESNETQMHLCRVFIFANMLNLSDLCSAAAHSYHYYLNSDEGHVYQISPEAVKYAYENYTEDDQLRKRMVEAQVEQYMRKGDGQAEQNLERWTGVTACNKHFLTDTMAAIRAHIDGSDRISSTYQAEGPNSKCSCRWSCDYRSCFVHPDPYPHVAHWGGGHGW